MEPSNSLPAYLQPILENPSNLTCFECDSESPGWVSINNGIFVCEICSQQHKKLMETISLLKPFSLEELTQIDIQYLKTGGNSKLKNFFEGFNIVKSNFSIQDKYKTKASVYYRLLLKNLVEGGELPDPPSINEGSQIEIAEEQKSSGWGFGYFKSAKNLLGTAVEKTSKGLSMLNDKIEKSHIVDKIVNVGGQVIDKSKVIGNEVYEKSKVVGSEVMLKGKEIGNEIIIKTKDLSHEALIKSKEYGKIISEKSIAFGNQVAVKGKELGKEVVNQTKKGYEQVSKSLNPQEVNEVHDEEMKEVFHQEFPPQNASLQPKE